MNGRQTEALSKSWNGEDTSKIFQRLELSKGSFQTPRWHVLFLGKVKLGKPPVDALAPKEEDIVIVSDDAIHKARIIQPGTLGFCLYGRNDVRDAKHLEQLLTLSIHGTCGIV